MRESDGTYFDRRADEERSAADRAACPEARLAHLEMAGRYDDLARAMAQDEPQMVLKIVD